MDQTPLEEPVLPVVRQPQGWAYFVGTWSGRLQVVNTLVFIVMLIKEPSSLLLPDMELIRLFGAKNLADISLGEYWRFFTPMFVHIGIIHFVFNTMGLNYIGYQLEYMLGGRWFILLYLSAGLVGNIASSVFNVRASAGASGALFGLLGAGFVLENSVSHRLEKRFGPKPRRRIYAGMVILNVVLGIFIPVIDNAAHVGGLVCGIVFVRALLWMRPNQLVRLRPRFGALLIACMVVLTVVGAVYAANPEITTQRYIAAARKANSLEEAWVFTQDALRVNDKNPEALLWAGRLLILAKHTNEGLDALEQAIRYGAADDSVKAMAEDLSLLGHAEESQRILEMLAKRPVI